MSHRTQITLTDDQYEMLLAESRDTGVAIAELVRRAVDRTYSQKSQDEIRKALEESFGAWSYREETGEEYVDNIRRGMAHRLEKLSIS